MGARKMENRTIFLILSDLAHAARNFAGATSKVTSSITMQAAGKNAVIKVSVDSCGDPNSPPPATSKFDLFLCTNVQRYVHHTALLWRK